MRHHFLGIAVGVLTSSFAASALAQSSAECHRIEAAAERVACYDRVTGRTAPAATTAAAGSTSAAAAPAPRESMIDTMWAHGPNASRNDVSLYRSNYILFGRYTDNFNIAPYEPLFAAAGKDPTYEDVEAKFQISFKGRMWTSQDTRYGLWFAYTQQSNWQLYTGDVSRPFRETNYMPEIFGTMRTDVQLPWGLRMGVLKFGFNHQSNGRSDILSRSWNRLIAETSIESENLLITARAWYRLSEDEEDDNNPGITRYLGYSEIGALYRWRGHSFTGLVRGNVGSGKGFGQVGWTTPKVLGPLRVYVQATTGYGESLIDYNWNQNTIGIGVSLNDAL
jgi:phospholipase A1/A2